MNALFVVDGAVFVLIGLVVLAVPSPQPALVRHVDEDVALRPFEHTRRLLASQFIGNGLLALLVGLASPGAPAVRLAAAARLATIALVLAINASQLRSGAWKRPPLYFIGAVLIAFGLGYARILIG
ncbi:MAG: hypothetical protein NT062_08290 [Proteobacteria bacterium]|nr:hypothetical protein [Pseudomonadota bacterium]